MRTQNKLSKQDFLTLMLLHVAHSDYNYSVREKYKISQANTHIHLKQYVLKYKEQYKYDIEKMFIDYFPLFYNDFVTRKHFFDELEALCKIDGIYCAHEKKLISHLKLLASFI